MYTFIRRYQQVLALMIRAAVLLGLLLSGLLPAGPAQGAAPAQEENSAYQLDRLVKAATDDPAQAVDSNLDPAALEQSGWYAQATAYIEASEYHFTQVEPNSYAAPNRAQNLRANFGPQGLRLTPRVAEMAASAWEVQLTLAGFGLQGAVQPIGKPTHTGANENRIEYTYPAGISEWYINDAAGLEQGFTIRELPQGAAGEAGALTLEFVLATALSPQLADSQTLELYTPESAIPIRYEGLHAFDATGSRLPAWLDLAAAPETEGGSYILRITVETASASLPIIIDPVFTWPWAIDPTEQNGAYFGMVVNTAGDVNGDGYDDITISAPGYDNGHVDEGRVYVYHGSADGPAPALDQNHDWQGDGQPGAWFGASVASAGDVDGDGYEDVLVGAPLFDTGTMIEGRVFLYRGGVTGILSLPDQELDPTDQDGAQFGWAVAAAGDANNDGFADFLVGAPGFSDASIGEGAAYLYLGGSSGPTLASGWPAHPTDQADGHFGEAVAGVGDVDGDTIDDFMVGAPGYGPYYTWEGAAYLFLGGLGAPDAIPDWQADPTDQAYAAFGTSLAAAGNADQDLPRTVTLWEQGFEEGLMPPTAWERRSFSASTNKWMLVNAGSNPSLVHSGSYAAWVSYDAVITQSEWLLSPAFTVTTDVLSTTLEFWVASDTLYPGATLTLYAIEASGAYTDTLWDMIAFEDWSSFQYRMVSADLSAYAGQSIRLAWEYYGLDGESLALDAMRVYGQTATPDPGLPDVIIGAPGYSGENSSEGRVYVYSGSSSGLETTPYWWADPTNQDNAQFGAAVSAIDPATNLGVVVGAPKYDDSIYWDEGRLYVFPSLGGLNEVHVCVLDPYQHTNNQMGQWVSPAGDTNGDGSGEILVGAYNALPSAGMTQEGYLLVLEVAIYGYGPWCELTSNAVLHPSDQHDAGFGLAASAGDFNGDGYVDVVGGAYRFDASAGDEGRVFAYYGTPHGVLAPAGETWYVDPSDQDYAYFGGAAEGAGDVNGDGYDDLIVGAPGFDTPSHTDQGMAMVYYGSPSGLTWQPVWGDSPVDQDNLEFGRSASTAGDVNNDGYADIIIGAPGYSDAAATEGKALVYFGSAQGLSDVPDWELDPTDQAGARFGWSVSSAGDMDHDGYDDIIVGAPYKDLAGQTMQGAGYIYRGSASGPGSSQWVILVANPQQAHANFGYAVAAAGDVNGDSYADVIVSAPYYNGSHTEMGRVFLFQGGSSAPTTAAWAVSPEPQHYAHVGFSIDGAGDVNGDGYDDVIVGSSEAYGYRDENGDVYEGRAYVYMGAPGGLSITPAWQADPTNQNAANFGMAVATAGDLNGDGYADIIIGAPYFDRVGSGYGNEGRMYLYYGSITGLTAERSPAWVADPANGDLSGNGYVVGTAGDVNADGYADVFVSTWNQYHVSCGVGVYVYHGGAGGLSLVPAWHGTGSNMECYGHSVSTAGDVNGDGYDDLVVGAFNYNSGDGRVYVYFGSASGLSATADWVKIDPAGTGARSQFGYAVGGAGDVDGDGYGDIIVGAPGYSGGGYYEEGRIYVFYGNATGFETQPSFDDPYNLNSAMLGRAVGGAGDVNGDGYADVIASAPGYRASIYSSAAILYQGSSSGLVYTALWGWYGSPAGTGELSVGTAGDVNGDGYSDVLIGSPGMFGGEGVAYVFHGSASGPAAFNSPSWFAHPNTEFEVLGAHFSWSSSTAGDVNGDGYADVIIGAPWLDCQHINEGRVYLYYGSINGLSANPDWTADPAEQDYAAFGRAVGFAGDVNGDGFADVMAGAPDYHAGYDYDGRAYLFYGAPGGLSASPELLPNPDYQSSAYFGFSVASAGDVNGDGYSDVILGAYNYDPGSEPEGKAYVFHGSASGLSATPDWATAPINNNGAKLGWSVGTAGDVNGDGYADVIIGAPGYGAAGNQIGRVYVYHGSASGLGVSADWTLDPGSPDQTNAQWGWSVGSAGDVNGDGYSDIIIGAPYYDFVAMSLADSGAAIVYHGSATGLTPPVNGADWFGLYTQAGAAYGYAVGTAGDVNNDSYADILVGIPYADNTSPAATDAGAVLAYYGSSMGLSAWTSPDWGATADQDHAHTGWSVATAGDVNGDGYADVIVGAPDYDTGLGTDEGRAYVFHGSPSGLATSANWYADPADQANAKLGNAVSSAGDVNGDGFSDVLIGARLYDDAGFNDSGQAYVYYGSAKGLQGTGLGYGQIDPDWQAGSGGETNAQYGFSVGSAGDVNGDGYSDVLIGVPLWNGEGTDMGAIYLYYGNGGEHPDAKPRQYTYDGSEPIGPMGMTTPPAGAFRINLLGRSPFGRGEVRLQWEIKPFYQPFDGTGLVTSAAWVDTTLNGAEIFAQPIRLDLGQVYHWRVRLVGRDPLPWTGRWFSPPFNARSENDLRAATQARQPIPGLGWHQLGESANKGNVGTQGGLSEIWISGHPNSPHPNAPSTMLGRFYELEALGTGWTLSEMCLYYDQSQVGSLNESELRLCRWTGTQWECLARSASSSITDNLACASDVTAFSEWGIATSVPTAVTLVSFRASAAPLPPYGLAMACMAALAGAGLLWRRRAKRGGKPTA